jgi:hypothetical protein
MAGRLGRRVLDPEPQQHYTTFQSLAALQCHGCDGRALIGLGLGGIEHAWRALRAVYGWTDDQVQLVNQPRAQKGAVSTASTFEQQALHAEFAIENVKRKGKVELGISGEGVGDALAAQARQVRVRDRFGKNHDDRITADIGTAPSDLAMRVKYDALWSRQQKSRGGSP